MLWGSGKEVWVLILFSEYTEVQSNRKLYKGGEAENRFSVFRMPRPSIYGVTGCYGCVVARLDVVINNESGNVCMCSYCSLSAVAHLHSMLRARVPLWMCDSKYSTVRLQYSILIFETEYCHPGFIDSSMNTRRKNWWEISVMCTNAFAQPADSSNAIKPFSFFFLYTHV